MKKKIDLIQKKVRKCYIEKYEAQNNPNAIRDAENMSWFIMVGCGILITLLVVFPVLRTVWSGIAKMLQPLASGQPQTMLQSVISWAVNSVSGILILALFGFIIFGVVKFFKFIDNVDPVTLRHTKKSQADIEKEDAAAAAKKKADQDFLLYDTLGIFDSKK